MDAELLIYVLIGFAAQLVDSSLGMAFGSLSSSLLLTIGLPPKSLSAIVHVAEIFGGASSAISHWRMKNLDFSLFKKLAPPAVIGAISGAFLVTQLDNETLRPWLGGYFVLIGVVILIKAIRPALIRVIKTPPQALGLFGGFLDAFGGAGWGEFVSSGLLLSGQNVRTAIGSLVTVEFMVATLVTLVFLGTIGISHLPVIAALSAGAILAAPLGAWICKKAPARPLMFCVGTVIITVGLKTVAGALMLP